jgi:3-isopropylmalate dehydrogenase
MVVGSSFQVACVEGDGVGPELFSAARLVLDSLAESFALDFEYAAAPAGDREFKHGGKALPNNSLKTIENSDACLKGPVGETARDTILRIRQELDLYANLRPAKNLPFVESKFPGVDLLIVRENTEDLYAGKEAVNKDGSTATALKIVTQRASTRIAEFAFAQTLSRQKNSDAKKRGAGSVICVTKSNVLPKSDGLFAKSCARVSREYPSIAFSEMYVDSAAMNLLRKPEAFDVIVTMNMYGDILSDEASQVVGGLGVAPSANIGQRLGLFEPVHGTAPDIAGIGIANPVAMLLSVCMMLEWLGRKKTSKDCLGASLALREAINRVGETGLKTRDIGGKATSRQVALAVAQEIRAEGKRKQESTLENVAVAS